ncbi:MAG: AmmeMemoRadiSam system radical SAM enzyme [Candidatus Omnitrophica bacterium]|nr:AmmeMemoRadiSam system radical SAM enzyme [Candidatus Omnitrophota bacterium]
MIKEAMLCEKLDNGSVRCNLCGHRCIITEESTGVCGVRKNIKGILYSLNYSQLVAANVDPIEKKPLYHFFPGTKAFSVACPGCNFQCGFCQNWQISQAARLSRELGGYELKPEEAVKQAKKYKCKSISFTYTEPTVFFEYAYDVARLSKEEGLYNNFVTNGFMSRESLEKISPYLDAANIDLKSFREDFYREVCKAKLSPVLDSIRLMRELNIWLEITTLVVPGQNDSLGELADIAGFISGLSKDIPWHISRFHPDYRFTDYQATSLDVLQRAQAIGKKAGLRYLYLGNVSEEPHTFCPNCLRPLIKRAYFNIQENNIKDSRCSFCGTAISGIFN